MPDIVTQAELAAMVGAEQAHEMLCISVRERILKGAQVEPGRYTVQAGQGNKETDAWPDGFEKCAISIIETGAASAQEQQKPDIPDWAKRTLDESSHAGETLTYDLWLNDPNGGPQELIPLSRKEYISLKHHLAELRGIEVPNAA